MKSLAIVGMACRFPKGLESIEALWNALKNRVSAIDTVPADRWSVDRYYSSNPIARGKSYIQRGGFLTHDVHRFDASFFGISPRDAENMDPQQRLLLEVVWEAFENSGMILPDYSGRKVGVYVGGFMLDHMITQMTPSNRSQINQNTAAGMMMTMLSNRISHTFDFRGPSLSIDTACSSSLVAFHYACQDMWRGQTELSIVGGSNVMLRPEYPMGMCKGHFLARDGECKSFDERGDGYGRGEGAGIVLLKPLEDALRDGDQVLASVIATGSNQDGRTPGISMPSGEAQQALIEEVCQDYEIDPATIRYVECHGTGTAVGDPTETRAIGATYGKAHSQDNPVVVGSIKSNIGHLEAAAGIAGIIKATLTLMHRETSPLANLQQPNPDIPLDDLNVRLSDEAISLGEHGEEIRVAVNSFGYGGSNAHAILQSAPVDTNSDSKPNADRNGHGTIAPQADSLPRFLPLSARSEDAVIELADKYSALLKTDASLDDVLYSASHHRAHLSHRAVACGRTRDDIIAALDAISAKIEHPKVSSGAQPYQGKRQPVFVFTGMGPQWWAMGQELYREDPIYRKAVDEADVVFREVSGFSMLEEMLKSEDDSRITLTEYAQPGNFMIQLGVVAVLKAAGIRPGAIVGHSVGELGSAYAAGVLSLKDAMTVCYHRSRLQASCKGTGAMLAVGLGRDDAMQHVNACDGRVSLAAVNGPTNITLAGDRDDLTQISVTLTQVDVFNRMLDVEVPYHSPMMDPIMDDIRTALSSVCPQAPQLPLYSTVTGALVEEASFGADYWPLNVRQPVEFATAIDALLADDFNTFLEIGPHPVLTTSIRDCAKVEGKEIRTLHTLRRKMPEQETLYRGLMSVFAEGCDVDWASLNSHGKFVALPNYAWQREYYWLENERAIQDRIASVVYPMLGIQEAPGTLAYRNDFDHEPMLYLRDHVVTGIPILPAAGYVESLLELAFLQFEEAEAVALRDLQIMAPMIITAERGLDSVTTFEPQTNRATIRSLENGRLGAGQVHVTSKLAAIPAPTVRRLNLDNLRQNNSQQLVVSGFYEDLNRKGLEYGPAFQTIDEISTSADRQTTLALICANEHSSRNKELYVLHPTVLDACFQALMPMLKGSDTTFLPTGFEEFCLYAKQVPSRIWSLAEIVSQNERTIKCDLTLLSESGEVLAALRGMTLTAAAKQERVDQFGDAVKRQILGYEWGYGDTLTEPRRLGHWLVIGGNRQLETEVINGIERYGATVVGLAVFGDEYSVDSICHTIRPDSIDDVNQMLKSVGELDGVVCLHGLNSTSTSDDPTGESALTALATLTQGMLQTFTEQVPRVYVVTSCAHETSDRDTTVEAAQAAINGFARVAFNEIDGMQFSTIDMPKRIDDRSIENLVLELICDAEHDEVALRGDLRLHSELLDSTVLFEDNIERQTPDDKHPVAVRPLRPDFESVGTARVVAAEYHLLADDEIRVRVDATLMPSDLLLDADRDLSRQAAIEIVGEVIEVGQDVTDLAPGTRVCGFAPTDIASQLTGPRESFVLVEMTQDCRPEELLSAVCDTTRAMAVSDMLENKNNRTALVYGNSLGRSLAAKLSDEGMQVAVLTDSNTTESVSTRFSMYSHCTEGIVSAMCDMASGGFDVVAVPCSEHTDTFGWRMLAEGGTVVDLDVDADAICLPSAAAGIIRSDLRSLMRCSDVLSRALSQATTTILNKDVDLEPALSVSVGDLAWQKLPLADNSVKLVLNFDMQEGDLPVVQTDNLSFCSEATYLITGGFGGFGQKTAEWLIANGAGALVLTGRSGANSPEKQEFVRQLEASGVKVLAAACDTSDYGRLKELFAEIDSTMPPLKGVFHSGAVILDEPIGEVQLDNFRKVMRSKALGAWNLHQLTQSMELDHFVLYSSLANLVGNSRQTAYSSANGFLNGLAHARAKSGLPATSVNWGAIADVGVVAQDEKLEQFLRYTGLRGLESAEGLELLKIGLRRKVPQFGVTVITNWTDWARFETIGSRSPRFASLIKADSVGTDDSTRQALVEELSTLNPADRVELLAGLLIETVAQVLKSSPEDIPADRPISQLGIDSLMATEIQLILDTQLGIQISILELIGDITIRSLAANALKTLEAAEVSA